jgi:hypothetical protein
MAEIVRVRVVPLLLRVPLVASVTVMSPTAKLVGSTSKVSVNTVVVTAPEVPLADKPEKLTGAGAVAGNKAATLPVLTAFVAVAPVTVKKFAATPVKVNPALGVSVIDAV